MINAMPLLTDELRKELIAEIDYNRKNCFLSSKTEILMQIGLAALTAEPVEHLTWHQGCRAPDDCEDYTVVAAEGDKSCDGSDAFPVYMAPPATEIKLPAEADGSNLPFAAMSWNACLAEVKRLNGVTK